MNPIIHSLKIEKKRLYIATAMLFALVATYMYLVSATIMHVVIRSEVDQSIVQLQSQISELESEYIRAQHRMSTDLASMSGFVAVEEKIFIDRGSDTLVLGGTLQ